MTISLRRLADNTDAVAGNTLNLALRWYPVMLSLYAAGIGAMAGESYQNLAAMLRCRVRDRRNDGASHELVVAAVDGFARAREVYKLIPEHERHYVPMSEHVFRILQPMIEDTLFLGSDYEWAFDRFEVLLALTYADSKGVSHGPLGRFAWKQRSHVAGPLSELREEARAKGHRWGAREAGLFSGDMKHFSELAEKFESNLAELSW